MADDIIDQSFPYGEAAALAGAKFREVETINSATGQVGKLACGHIRPLAKYVGMLVLYCLMVDTRCMVYYCT